VEKLILGIDFGTSTNFVTKYDFKKRDAVPVENMAGYGKGNIFENVIYIEGDGKYVLGDRKKYLLEPHNYFEDIKRHITSDSQKWIVPNLGDREVTATDVAEKIFSKIRERVEESHGGERVEGAVITVPYAYGDKYRKRVKEAAERAGIPVIKLVEEPVAAAISFGVFGDEIENGKEENIVVFDFGGGTFDLTIFKFQKSDKQNARIEVLNTGGEAQLGGRDIDKLISEKFRTEDLGVEYSDIVKDKERARLQIELGELAKETKEELSEIEESDIYKGFTINLETKEIERELQRTKFEDWLRVGNIVGRVEDALDIAIDEAGLSPEDIDRVILAGGSSSIPLIKDVIRDFFGFEPEARKSLGELVGHGAGVVAGLSMDDSLHYQVIRKTNKSIGVAVGNKFKKILRKNSRYGEVSPPYKLRIDNLTDKLVVYFYEGESGAVDECERIGKAEIDGTLFETNRIGLSLYRDDDSGEMGYIFYNESGDEVLRGEISEVE
jgi:molecular chaperone DnaK (HSP70)